MNFKIKRFFYLINDFTNFVLKKNRDDSEKKIRTLSEILLVVVIVLIISLILNLFFYLEVSGMF